MTIVEPAQASAPSATDVTPQLLTKRRFGIGAKLTIACGLLSLATVVACLVAVLAFDQLGTLLRDLAERRLPQVTAVHQLDALGARVTSEGTLLLEAATIEVERALQQGLAGRVREMATLVDRLEALGLDAERLAAVRSAVATLTDHLGQIDDQAKKRFALIADRTRIAGDLEAAQLASMDAATKAVEQADLRLTAEINLLALVAAFGDAARGQPDQQTDAIAPLVRELHAGPMRAAALMHEILTEVRLAGTLLRQAAETTEAGVVEQVAGDFETTRRQLVERIGGLSPEARAGLQPAVDRMLAFGVGRTGILEMRRAEFRATALGEMLLDQNRAVVEQMSDAVARIVELAQGDVNALAQSSIGRLEQARTLMALLALGSVVLAVVVVWGYVVRGLLRRLIGLSTATVRVASGTLDAAIPSEGNDEITDMARALGTFRDRAVAARVISERIARSTRQVVAATNQATAAVGQVAEGAQAQMQVLKQVTEGLNQALQAISDVTTSTQSASDQAKRATALTDTGIQEIERVVEVVTAVHRRSAEISKITDAIASIARQTNMLSLNAAIEAARAGEQGKGFAVVAEEVRKLAESSDRLASEITDQTEAARGEADGAARAVGKVDENIRKIATGVRSSERLSAAIATAMEQQRETVITLNQTLAGLTRIGESNATAAEQITATMSDLSGLAEKTREEMEQFNRLGG